MKRTAIMILASLALVAPSMAKDWGSDYNMGSIGVSGGDEASGMIVIDCAESGNGVVPVSALSIFLTPAAGSQIGATSVGELTFSIGGTDVVLPVADNGGDGFVFDKTSETLSAVTQLLDLLETGDELVVTASGEDIARIDLGGAGEALDGVEACLVP